MPVFGLQETHKCKKMGIKFCTIFSEVLFFVGNPVVSNGPPSKN